MYMIKTKTVMFIILIRVRPIGYKIIYEYHYHFTDSDNIEIANMEWLLCDLAVTEYYKSPDVYYHCNGYGSETTTAGICSGGNWIPTDLLSSTLEPITIVPGPCPIISVSNNEDLAGNYILHKNSTYRLVDSDEGHVSMFYEIKYITDPSILEYLDLTNSSRTMGNYK